jgi:Leucine-rich repeat (LRR) protein
MSCLTPQQALISLFPTTFASDLNKSLTYFSITLDFKNYETIPGNLSLGLSYTIKALQMSRNKIKCIDKYAFVGVQSLATLYLEDNHITDLSFLSIPDMKFLTELNIKSNMLTTVDPAWFTYVTSLSSLIMAANLIVALGPNVFANSPKLKNLDLSSNQIETLHPQCFTGLRMLTTLGLYDNRIRVIESNVTADLINVVSQAGFQLNSQGIQDIMPFAFRGFAKIQWLVITSNSLTSLRNNTFTGLSNLNKLELSLNKISVIEPNAFSGLNQLKILNLSFNLLKTTHQLLFVYITSLETLYLSDNKISIVGDKSFNGLEKSLKSLNLARNKLKFVKNGYFGNLSELQILDLSSNTISIIENLSFRNLRNLNTLVLSDNCIFKINSVIFQNQRMLSQLYLDNNLLKNIEMAFFNLHVLTNLNLAFNSIYKLTNQTFEGCDSLASLNLSFNFIKSLNKSLVSLKSLRVIELKNNRIQTDGQDQFYFDSKVQNHEFSLQNTSIDIIKTILSSGIKISKLELSFNNLSAIISNISFQETCDLLTHLDLRQAGLNGYEVDSLNLLKNLTLINLSGNLIKFKGKFLPNTKNLNSLSLSNINITTPNFESFIDLSFFGSLKSLDMSVNSLETIRATYFRSNPQLGFLNISFNKIKQIEDRSLPNLISKLIDISFNQIQSIADINFFDNPYPAIPITIKISALYAANNNLESFDMDFLPGSKLKANMSSNRLTTVPEKLPAIILDMNLNIVRLINRGTFNFRMAGLQELYMSFNIINSIEDDSFKILNKLVRLDLSNNYLTKLGNDTFAGLFSLTYLNFNNNSIQVVQTSLFRQLINLEELYLSSNPIKLIEDKAFLNLNFLRVLNIA